jgi:hypothetical protein
MAKRLGTVQIADLKQPGNLLMARSGGRLGRERHPISVTVGAQVVQGKGI